jgi:hypothetical protein
MVDKGLVCSICNITVARPSHLERHRQSHLRRNERTLERCQHCDLSFSRRDVLLRHLRSTHHIEVNAVRSIRKSCTRCVERKLKCDRLQPCQTCVKAKFECTFVQCEPSTAASSRMRSGRQVLTSAANTPTTLIHCVTLDDAIAAATARDSRDNGSIVSKPHQLALTRQRTSSDAVPPEGMDYLDDSLEDDSVQLQASTSIVLNDSGMQQRLTEHSIEMMPAMAEPYNTETPTAFEPSELFTPWADNLNWLDFTLDSTWRICNDSHIGDTATSVAPTRAGTRGGPDIIACLQRPPVQEWPFEDDLDGDMPPTTSYATLQLCLDVETEFSKHVRTLLERDVLPDIEHLTDHAFLNAHIAAQTAVDAYFTQFHEILPLVHKPTCRVSGRSSILVAAMASIGAMSSLSERPRHEIRVFSRAYLSQTTKQVLKIHTPLTFIHPN